MLYDQCIVITGGPGMGKTAILNELGQRGFLCIPESGRSIICNEIITGGNRLPWGDREGYAKAMFDQGTADLEAVQGTKGPVFFDRGLPDTMGYLQLCGLPVPVEMEQRAKEIRYHRQVFIAPPWPAIYVQDKERKQDFEEAVSTYEKMHNVYTNLGYQLTEIPRMAVSERAGFILASIF